MSNYCTNYNCNCELFHMKVMVKCLIRPGFYLLTYRFII